LAIICSRFPELCVIFFGTFEPINFNDPQFHTAPQEWSDFYHCLQNVSPISKKKPMRLCHSCYGSISKQFACSALERVGPNNNNDADIAVVDVVATSKPIIKKSSIGGNGKSAFC
jgi:hypothetical protein